jgi:hypothetical protein
VTVSTFNGSTSASQQFAFTAQPTITFFSPTFGGPGAVINMFGTFFNNVTGVTFGGIPARSFTVISPTQLQAVVGQGATGNIAVIAQGGVGFSTSQFMFTPTSVRASDDASFEALPNPANTSALFRYTLPQPASVKLDIYSMLGEKIMSLDDGLRSAGTYTLPWSVESIAQGVYSCRLQVDGQTKILLLRVVK